MLLGLIVVLAVEYDLVLGSSVALGCDARRGIVVAAALVVDGVGLVISVSNLIVALFGEIEPSEVGLVAPSGALGATWRWLIGFSFAASLALLPLVVLLFIL